uniref:TGc domain-containing protein n=1 Tax=Macrostomum lignano TaxID=282301 RepID=A0A1I8H883_9PLAT
MQVITGYKKGIGYESGLRAPLGGVWFACYVEGEWRFIDPHWSAQSVSGFEAGNYRQVDERGLVNDVTEVGGTTVYDLNEFWFLTDPHQFVVSHFPSEDQLEWQLLARPLQFEEFEEMIDYFDGTETEMNVYQLETVSHPKNVIISKPGSVEILLRELTNEQYMYEMLLKIHKKHIADGSNLAHLTAYQQKACVSKAIRVSKSTVKFIFEPPHAGQYALAIRLWRYVSDERLKGSTFVTYASTELGLSQFYPDGHEDLNEFGSGQEMREEGLSSDESGELRAANGEATFEITALEDRFGIRNLMCQALGPDNKPLPTSSVLVWRDNHRNAFLFLAPDSGYYALVLYENGRPVGQFLVDASSEAKDGASFPLPDWSRVGGLGLAAASKANGGGCRLVPLSHQTPYVRTEEFELAMRFGVDGAGEEGDAGIDLKSEMLGIGADGGTESVGDYSLVSGVEGGGFEVRCRFPRAGHYLLRLSFRESGGDWRPYFTYFVRAVGQLDGSASAFPSLGADWPVGGALIEPLDRTLSVGQPTPIRLRFEDATAVGAVEVVDERSGSREPLSRDPQDPRLWFGSVTASAGNTDGANTAGSGGVTVVARVNDGVETQLVKFDVESESSAEAKAAALREARELNERRRVAEENRQRKQENRHRRDKGLESLPVWSLAAAKAAAEAKAALKAAAMEASKLAALALAVSRAVAESQSAVLAAADEELETKTAADAKDISAASYRSEMTEKAAVKAKLAAESANDVAAELQALAAAAAEEKVTASSAADAASKAAEAAAFDAEIAGSPLPDEAA